MPAPFSRQVRSGRSRLSDTAERARSGDPSDAIEIKIAYIGGGSRYWARDLLAELAQAPGLTGSVDLFDLNEDAAAKNTTVANAIFSRPEATTRFQVRAVKRLEEALRGADFVVISIEPGPMTLRHADLVVPARFGIVQPVGDTTGPGGIVRALRSIPLFVEFGQKIARHCPRAWVINYTNPMTLCTAALYSGFPDIRAFGCCHEVFHTQQRLARLVARWFGVAEPPRQAITLDLAGVNHFTWATAASWQGQDLRPHLQKLVGERGFFRSRERAALARKRAGRWFESDGLVAFDLFRRFGALGAAGDRHLAEFVPWYSRSEDELHRWGVVVTPFAWRKRRHAAADRPVSFYANRPLAPSDEEGVRLIEALLGIAPLDTNLNLPNRGQMSTLPAGHIVETYAQARRGRVTPLTASPLPAGAHALVRRVADVQALTLQAALARDVDLAFQAVLADPLVSLSTDDAWAMFTTMLRGIAPALPGWTLPA